MRKTHGFTLVELLVVIGIIAILISILLPSLARARQHANNLLCMSNLRQVHQGLMFYANDHAGKLPFSGHDQWYSIWPGQVSLYMGADLRPIEGNQWGNFDGKYSAILRCPDAPLEATVQDSWNGGCHYTSNVRAMPQHDDRNSSFGVVDPPGGTKPMPAYPLATKDAASKILMWDGALFSAHGWMAAPCYTATWWWQLRWGYAGPDSWGYWFADPGFTGPGDRVFDSSMDGTVGAIANREPQSDCLFWSQAEAQGADRAFMSTRFRHLGDTSINVLFFDGHVESRKINQVLWREICIFPYQ